MEDNWDGEELAELSDNDFDVKSSREFRQKVLDSTYIRKKVCKSVAHGFILEQSEWQNRQEE